MPQRPSLIIKAPTLLQQAYARSGDAEKALVWLQSMKERNEVSPGPSQLSRFRVLRLMDKILHYP